MKKLFLFTFLLFSLLSAKVSAANISGKLVEVNNLPIKGATVFLSALSDGQLVEQTITSDKGNFELHNIKTGNYTLQCSFIGFVTYRAELQIVDGRDMNLSTIVMSVQNVEVDEIEVSASRNVFSIDKQIIYPSERQINASNGGLDLLQKQRIPLVEIDAISQSIKSNDPSGSAVLYINDIPSEPNEVAILNPNQIKRIEVRRNPGPSYGDNVATAINIVTKFSQDGIDLGVSTNNSLKFVYGYNNVFGTYNHKHSQLSVSRTENFQNYKHLSVSDTRLYLMPNGEWHNVEINSLSSHLRTITESTMMKYNLTLPDNLVLQLNIRLGQQRNPKQTSELLLSETDKNDYVNTKNISDEYKSPSLNLYFKKYLTKKQSLVINVVGTHIGSDYEYLCQQTDSLFQTNYTIDGNKSSVITEAKYVNGFEKIKLSTGLRHFYSDTHNVYNGTYGSDTRMTNTNIKGYLQIDGTIGRFSGSVSLILDNQNYKQGEEQYNKLSFNPRVNLRYAITDHLRISYKYDLAQRLPQLAQMNDVAIQKDQWERTVGNPNLKPFNHVENTLGMSYDNGNLQATFRATYGFNKQAIMPYIVRTETDNHIYYDNSNKNQRDMNQLMLSSYVSYSAFDDRLIVSTLGYFNYYRAQSDFYQKKHGYVSGSFALESYLGNFYLCGKCESRYNSLFAETIYYNEYTSSINVTYSWKNFNFGLLWEQPLQKDGTNHRIETSNNYVRKYEKYTNADKGNNVVLSISWRWHHGLKSKVQNADIDNADTEAGVLK